MDARSNRAGGIMSVQRPTTEVETAVQLRVPRGEAGSLQDGVRAVLASIDAVRQVTVHDIGTVRPDAFDLYVDATARVELAAENPAMTLADGFGVVTVDRCEVR
ncbi:hypothetical protein [Halosegnis sp.]|uniref:hypothetical protein n=1 Tax=Halosegnis sp. TaxID=2864959 RepID=UPI0035D465B3